MRLWVTNHHSYSQWVLKPVGLPTLCTTELLLPVCSNLKYCNLQTLFTLFCDNKRVGSTMWLRRDNIIVQRLPMTIMQSTVSIVVHEYTTLIANTPNYVIQYAPHNFLEIWGIYFFVYREPQVLLCAFLHSILVEIKPVKPGFSTAPKPGFTGLKTAGLPGFSGTRVSFPRWAVTIN